MPGYAMPTIDQLFNDAALKTILEFNVNIEENDEDASIAWDDDFLVNSFQVDMVPITLKLKVNPEYSNNNSKQAWYDDLVARGTANKAGLKHFVPCDVSPINVGSNVGLLRILRTILEPAIFADSKEEIDPTIKKAIITSDCQIHMRIMKVNDV